jgi:DsbC/DsbD-like thiol-disulfide interchange protein
MTFKPALRICALTLATAFNLCPASATAKDPIGTMAEVSLLPGWAMDNGHYMAALQVKLAPGWHTYWRAPGAAGIPPQFDWSGSRNISGVQFHWPIPDIYVQNDMPFLGYETELILPIEFTASDTGNIVVKGEITMGVCEDVCMPYTTTFQGTLNADTTATNRTAIQTALDHQPKHLSGARCAATAIEDGMKITATIHAPNLGAMEMAVLEHPDPNVWVSEATSNRTGRTVTIKSDMVPPQAKPFFVDRSQLRITLIGVGGKAYEARGCSGS